VFESDVINYVNNEIKMTTQMLGSKEKVCTTATVSVIVG
jgi:hypothetical protein